MGVNLVFLDQQNGGWHYRLEAKRPDYTICAAVCWRKGTQKEIQDYHQARYVKRFKGDNRDIMAPVRTSKTKKSMTIKNQGKAL